MSVTIFRLATGVALSGLLLLGTPAMAQVAGAPAAPASAPSAASRNLAPGFTHRAAQSRVVVVPVDMELFSMSGGGVLEPKADWTELGMKNFRSGLTKFKPLQGNDIVYLPEKDLDELADINALHGAVAQAVALHHFAIKLPTKDDKLDWSMGDAVAPLRQKTGADYALFTWVRDSYASAERKAAMVALAIFGIGIPLGAQVGYASLVDLNTGRVVWFNRMFRPNGDLRDEKSAQETVETLLAGLPGVK